MFIPLWVLIPVGVVIAILLLEWSINIDGPAGCVPMLASLALIFALGMLACR